MKLFWVSIHLLIFINQIRWCQSWIQSSRMRLTCRSPHMLSATSDAVEGTSPDSMPNPRHRPPIPAESAGKIHLLGAGPGDPNLLTLEAIKLFNSASLVVADRLIAQEILDLIPCELKVANKRPGCAEEAQEEIYDWCYSALKEGRHVVRLKIGDVFLFGRGGEEILEFRKWGIESNISPGISSSYSAPLAAGIPLTHRGVSNQVIISTGYGQDSKDVDVPEYVEDRTVVLLMAVGRIAAIAKRLVMKGYPTSTPVAIIEKATTPRQRTLYGTLEDIGDIAKREEAKPPATIVIGDVVHVLDA